MVVKVAMPQQFKLKVVPSLKGLLFPNQKEVHYIGGSEVPAASIGDRTGNRGDQKTRIRI